MIGYSYGGLAEGPILLAPSDRHGDGMAAFVVGRDIPPLKADRFLGQDMNGDDVKASQ